LTNKHNSFEKGFYEKLKKNVFFESMKKKEFQEE